MKTYWWQLENWALKLTVCRLKAAPLKGIKNRTPVATRLPNDMPSEHQYFFLRNFFNVDFSFKMYRKHFRRLILVKCLS